MKVPGRDYVISHNRLPPGTIEAEIYVDGSLNPDELIVANLWRQTVEAGISLTTDTQ